MKRFLLPLAAMLMLSGCGSNVYSAGEEVKTVELVRHTGGRRTSVTIRDVKTGELYENIYLSKHCSWIEENGKIGEVFDLIFDVDFVVTGSGDGWKMYKPSRSSLQTKYCRYQEVE